ncbi:MAG: hypothetical protein EG823_03720 [Actinobacteria bacterium]|nr:hypothetical protein [Actinomycetota bacterium]
MAHGSPQEERDRRAATVVDSAAGRVGYLVDRFAAAAAVFALSALGFLALNEPWVSDDFSGALFLKEHPGLWDTVSTGYLTWTGRFASSAFSWLACQIRPVYGIVIWSGLLLLVVMTFALARGRLPRPQRADLYVLAVVLASYWFGLPAIEETVFWTSGSVVYLWPAVAALSFLYLYRRLDSDVEPQKRPGAVATGASVLGMLVLGVVVGASQEQVLAASLLYVALLAWRAARSGRLRRIPVRFWAGAGGLVAAGAVSLAAPGNSQRLEAIPAESMLRALVESAKYTVHILVDWLPPLMPWLACLALLAVPVTVIGQIGVRAASPRRLLSRWWVWALLGVSTVVTMMVHPYFAAERTVMFLGVFLVVAAVSLMGEATRGTILERLPARTASGVVCLLLVIVAGDAALSGWQARELRLGQLEREQRVAELKEQGVRDITLASLTNDLPRRGVMWGDGTTDETFWINGILADWYGVDSVVIADEASARVREP